MLQKFKSFGSFSVDNIENAMTFYKDILGLNVTKERMGLLELHLNGMANSILIYPKPNHIPASFTILNFAVEDIDETVDELTRRGVKFEQYDMDPIKTDKKGIARSSEGPLIAWFKDPAGNILSVLKEK